MSGQFNINYVPRQDVNNLWFVEGPGLPGQHGGCLFPESRFATREEAERAARLCTKAYDTGYEQARTEIKRALRVPQIMNYSIGILNCLEAAERGLAEFSDNVRVSIKAVPGYPSSSSVCVDVLFKGQVHHSAFQVTRGASDFEFSARFSRSLHCLKRYCEEASCK